MEEERHVGAVADADRARGGVGAARIVAAPDLPVGELAEPVVHLRCVLEPIRVHFGHTRRSEPPRRARRGAEVLPVGVRIGGGAPRAVGRGVGGVERVECGGVGAWEVGAKPSAQVCRRAEGGVGYRHRGRHEQPALVGGGAEQHAPHRIEPPRGGADFGRLEQLDAIHHGAKVPRGRGVGERRHQLGLARR
eukprot:scaffold118650_cov62-Phaeocystis_antarctica.AAC.5